MVNHIVFFEKGLGKTTAEVGKIWSKDHWLITISAATADWKPVKARVCKFPKKFTFSHYQGPAMYQSQRTVTTARADYERVHDRLMLEIPQLVDQRKSYFGACLQAVVNAQVSSASYNDTSNIIYPPISSESLLQGKKLK